MIDIGNAGITLLGLLFTWDQLVLGPLGVTAIRLVNDPREHVKRWGCIFGMAGQPFWYYTTFVNQQWAIFFLCFFYTEAWWKGVRTHWLRRPA
jgi:hypothetical protein